jgi:putative FmdB family regulatory protein
MPLYDYDCLACGRRIEVIHGVHSPGPAHCPNCGAGPLRKAISAPAVHFKGSGWAKRDRRATVNQAAAKASGDTDGQADGSGPDKADKPGKAADTSTEPAADGAKGGDKRDSSPAPAKRPSAGTATKTGA